MASAKIEAFCARARAHGTLMKLATVLLPEVYLVGLDELVRSGMYSSRSAAIREAVRDLLKREL